MNELSQQAVVKIYSEKLYWWLLLMLILLPTFGLLFVSFQG